jgi:hypothetical protein
VWVDKSNVEAAQSLIGEYEQQRRRRQSTLSAEQCITVGSIDVVCEECGAITKFPVSKDGTTQDCSYCGAFVDVGDDPFDWAVADS